MFVDATKGLHRTSLSFFSLAFFFPLVAEAHPHVTIFWFYICFRNHFSYFVHACFSVMSLRPKQANYGWTNLIEPFRTYLCSWEVTIKSPSLFIFVGLYSRIRNRTSGGIQSALARLNRISTLVFSLFTFWPPGPELREYLSYLRNKNRIRLIKMQYIDFIEWNGNVIRTRGRKRVSRKWPSTKAWEWLINIFESIWGYWKGSDNKPGLKEIWQSQWLHSRGS